MASNLCELQSKLNYQFQCIQLLTNALTHCSSDEYRANVDEGRQLLIKLSHRLSNDVHLACEDRIKLEIAISSDEVLHMTCDKLLLNSYIIGIDESLDLTSTHTIEHYLLILQSIMLDQDGDEEKVEQVVRKTLLDIAYLICERPIQAPLSVISLIEAREKWNENSTSDDEGQDFE